ncbi:ParA family protein [Streptomyces sp. NPDC001732]
MIIANISPRSMGKTTDTGMMGHAFHKAGYPVQLWDADESEHLKQWSEIAEFPFPVHRNASAKFAEECTPLGEGGIDIVDVGHTENHPHIADSVLKVADLVIVHMEPSMADYQRVHQPRTSTPVKTMVGRSSFDRPSRTAPPMWVLLNRVRPNVRSEGEIRDLLLEADYNVLTVKIPVLDEIKQATGFPVVNADRGPFGELVTELQTRGLVKDA